MLGRNLLAEPETPQKGPRRFRLRNDNFACELKNFACETILFRPTPHKLLKSLGSEMSVFAVSCDSKGLKPVFFRAALFAVPFSIWPSDLALI
jgi:hypothetical protein